MIFLYFSDLSFLYSNEYYYLLTNIQHNNTQQRNNVL